MEDELTVTHERTVQAPAGQLILWRDADAETAERAAAALVSELRSHGSPGGVPAPAFLEGLGIAVGGSIFLRVDHPRYRERPDPNDLASNPAAALEREVEFARANLSYAQRARQLWLETDRRWHPLAEGVGLMMDPCGPKAELDRRRAVAAREDELDAMASALAAEKELECARCATERATRQSLWDALPRAVQIAHAAASRVPEELRSVAFAVASALAEVDRHERVPMPGEWRP